MTAPEIEFEVLSGRRRVAALPWSHLSIELGHLYMEDFNGGLEKLRRYFARIRPWVDTVRSQYGTVNGKPARISTCFLIDDYFSRLRSPDEILPGLLTAATEAGIPIDYLARESACAVADDLRPAELVLDRLSPDPPSGYNGYRGPSHETGWLANGERSPRLPHESAQAMKRRDRWAAPRENSARLHSIFMDVELWQQRDNGRLWSCAYLAAVWQLLRLGVLRDQGQPILRPVPFEGEFPGDWAALPPIVQVNPGAKAFWAFKTCTVMDEQFITIEAAVRTILAQVAVNPDVHALLQRAAADQGVELSAELVKRVSHVFFEF